MGWGGRGRGIREKVRTGEEGGSPHRSLGGG